MKTILEKVTITYTEKNSKFIATLFPLLEKEEIKTYLEMEKHLYKDATHHCYAYCFENEEKASDDNEPNGTAGRPILNVLKQKNLKNVLAIVTRYFGGIKLGSGGLVRAYTKSVTLALNEAKMATLEDAYKVMLQVDYNKWDTTLKLLEDASILEKEYKQKITATTIIPKEKVDILNQNKIEYHILSETKIRREEIE